LQSYRSLCAQGAKTNPYAKLWGVPASAGLKQLLLGVKRFISSIEIPGLTRPHPWVSPLHLSGRFGRADIAFLLLKRGAAANGADAAKYATKSPLEEALMYARANAQSYGTESKRRNYTYIVRGSAWFTARLIARLRIGMNTQQGRAGNRYRRSGSLARYSPSLDCFVRSLALQYSISFYGDPYLLTRTRRTSLSMVYNHFTIFPCLDTFISACTTCRRRRLASSTLTACVRR
jgi:hypothetical protein